MSRQMKYSGIEWIGEIPEDWSVCNIKYYCYQVFAGGTPETSKTEYWDGDIPWIPSGSVQNCMITTAPKFITRLGYEKSSTKLIKKDTTIMAMTGATCANVGFLTFESCANQSVVAFIENENTDSKYLFYSLLAANEEILLKKTGGAQAGINTIDCKNILIPYIAIKKQQKIADILDKRCEEIEKYIALQEKMIDELKDYKQSVITEAVTKGLDKSVPMKDSGIEWIGEIPQHWGISKIKNFVRITNGREVEDNEGDIPVFGSGGQFGTTSKVMYDKETVLLGRKGTIDRPQYIIDNTPIWCVDTTFYTKKKKYANMKYFYYCMISVDFQEYIYGTALPSMTQTILNNINLPLPKTDIQESIADYLDKKCSAIDKLISNKQTKIDELKEYKKSLIYEYVTGKKEVV